VNTNLRHAKRTSHAQKYALCDVFKKLEKQRDRGQRQEAELVTDRSGDVKPKSMRSQTSTTGTAGTNLQHRARVDAVNDTIAESGCKSKGLSNTAA